MGPRWKGKQAEAKALAEPISRIISMLQSSLKESDSQGLLSDSCVLLKVDAKQADLLNRACFGRPIITAQKDKQWLQLSMEEAFYLCYALNCIKIVGKDNCIRSYEDLWAHMTSTQETFLSFYKAYSHLRMKNWVVRPGSQYGVDFVAYRHHPALVHSEYAVLVLSDGNGEANGRLRVWSDFQGALRLCGSVAKSMLVLNVSGNGNGSIFPSFLESYSIEERIISRWNPERCREDPTEVENRTNFMV